MKIKIFSKVILILMDSHFPIHHRPDEIVLKDLNFSILPDQLVALVGVSGSGKTTITSLITETL